jgi:hypothetical protein
MTTITQNDTFRAVFPSMRLTLWRDSQDQLRSDSRKWCTTIVCVLLGGVTSAVWYDFPKWCDVCSDT